MNVCACDGVCHGLCVQLSAVRIRASMLFACALSGISTIISCGRKCMAGHCLNVKVHSHEGLEHTALLQIMQASAAEHKVLGNGTALLILA